ncbi:VanZ family protein [Roseovarius sp. SYSU LYC5161]|uniref:VanZ family protein n=1 Tax=Roseovarius halophilus (ex Wu et al. 2025) TaxID=3376060 RepID=UPI00287131D2|nr:VanZ family protein [Roseovarius sp.]
MKPAALLLTVLTALGIAVGTLGPPGDGAGALPVGDKTAHFLAFALLVLPAGLGWPRQAVWLAAAAVLYGTVIEIVQPAVGRSAEWGDLLADTAGIAVGLLPGRLLQRRNRMSAATRDTP